jgi:hypothetical protein
LALAVELAQVLALQIWQQPIFKDSLPPPHPEKPQALQARSPEQELAPYQLHSLISPHQNLP